MANIKSVAKRARQSIRRRTRNASVTSALKTSQKRVASAIASGDLATAKTEYVKFASELDKAAKRGVIHKNSADRRKGSFNRALQPKKD